MCAAAYPARDSKSRRSNSKRSVSATADHGRETEAT
jgi:hypothetical protein